MDLQTLISNRKASLAGEARAPMAKLARRCAAAWGDADRIDGALRQGMSTLGNCDLLYAFDIDGKLVSSNIERETTDTSMRGHDFQGRPYLESNLPYKGIVLSRVYISRYNGRSCITILQAIRRKNEVIGFIAADYDVDNLQDQPPEQVRKKSWSQYKGDPAIRGTLFMQERVESKMDRHLDETMHIIQNVILDRGVFHVKIHFSSSRASFWKMDDPYDYRIYTVNEIRDPGFGMAFHRQEISSRVVASRKEIERVLCMLKVLRKADETIYLRSASFNLINGIVGLTFSCDGSHYLNYREFLDRNIRFWFGDRSVDAETGQLQDLCAGI
jgi:hypothetical protein